MTPTPPQLSRRHAFGVTAALGLGAGLSALPQLTEIAAAMPPIPEPGIPDRKVLRYTYQRQATQNWCAAASGRIALSAKGKTPTQNSLRKQMGIGPEGSHGLQEPREIAWTLNARLGLGGKSFRYRLYIPAAGTLKERLRYRTRISIHNGYPVVINMNSVAGEPYSAGHYIAIVGYDKTRYKIADPDAPSRNGVWYHQNDIVDWNKRNRFTAFGT
ncbi:C39 family peptidase [Desertihabitans aurantiacus]|uniref:C39 family peptidase n=1 Tax=Desertihabitans aurantiacus TaxID=2282477 RepID=UPI000DF7A596|nr:C39 family peptidase [Desertihabitans aurantiacus]